MNTGYQEARLQEAFDGTQSWDMKDFCPDDPDTFRTQVVDPLRHLRSQGYFEIEELMNHANGRSYVFAVEITSPINFDP